MCERIYDKGVGECQKTWCVGRYVLQCEQRRKTWGGSGYVVAQLGSARLRNLFSNSWTVLLVPAVRQLTSRRH